MKSVILSSPMKPHVPGGEPSLKCLLEGLKTEGGRGGWSKWALFLVRYDSSLYKRHIKFRVKVHNKNHNTNRSGAQSQRPNRVAGPAKHKRLVILTEKKKEVPNTSVVDICSKGCSVFTGLSLCGEVSMRPHQEFVSIVLSRHASFSVGGKGRAFLQIAFA